MESLKKPLTVRDIAPVLGVSTKTVYELAKRGEIPSFTYPGSRLRFFRESDIANWIGRLDREGRIQ
jgi:excisionase family DNA binding protein